MTTHTHTAGPWHISEKKEGGYNIIDGDHLNTIVTTSDFHTTYWKPNAALIAAAPELLDALESAVYDMEELNRNWHELGLGDDNPISIDTIAAARAAIAKAKGGD